jgi:hypothetical protein
LPDANYTRGISTLNRLGNVRTIGYVATTWGKKEPKNAIQEIATYSGWAGQDVSVGLDGIFFDETPAAYHPDYAGYLKTVSEAVRSADGLGSGYVGKWITPKAHPHVPQRSTARRACMLTR